MIQKYHAVQYDLLENYRSDWKMIDFANLFIAVAFKSHEKSACSCCPKEESTVKLFSTQSQNLEVAVVVDMLESRKGTTCILTGTNQQALCVMGILMQKNVPAKLIQNNNGFDIYNIAEIRYFLKRIKQQRNSPIISETLELCKRRTENRYSASKILPLILEILKLSKMLMKSIIFLI